MSNGGMGLTPVQSPEPGDPEDPLRTTPVGEVDAFFSKPGGPLGILGFLLGLFTEGEKGDRKLNKAGEAAVGLGGSLLSSYLNRPSAAQRGALSAQTALAEAQAGDVMNNIRLKRQLEALIGGLKPLSGEAKNELIRLRPGKSPDFSGVRGTGDIDLLMQLAGLGHSGTSAVNQAAALAQGDISQGRKTTETTIENLITLLLGLGGGGGIPASVTSQMNPLQLGTITGDYVPFINSR